MTSIGAYAFEYCEGLTSITLPESVTTIGMYAFTWCSGLASINIPESVTSIGERAFEYCEGLTSITLPENVTSIGDYAFRGSSLTSITIPEGVTSIGKRVFDSCNSLTSITIPEGVTNIGEYAFGFCANLTSITSYATVPPVCGECVFAGIDKLNCTLHVPVGSLAAYQAADQWKEFLLIEDDVETGIEDTIINGKQPEAVYDLNGRRVLHTDNLKGIYIVGGKKVVVK